MNEHGQGRHWSRWRPTDPRSGFHPQTMPEQSEALATNEVLAAEYPRPQLPPHHVPLLLVITLALKAPATLVSDPAKSPARGPSQTFHPPPAPPNTHGGPAQSQPTAATGAGQIKKQLLLAGGEPAQFPPLPAEPGRKLRERPQRRQPAHRAPQRQYRHYGQRQREGPPLPHRCRQQYKPNARQKLSQCSRASLEARVVVPPLTMQPPASALLRRLPPPLRCPRHGPG
jgi:hypothetical protein